MPDCQAGSRIDENARADDASPIDDRPAVIVPTYNRLDLLAALLVSLREQTVQPEIIVVDNGSSDGTAAGVATRFPEVRVVALPTNVGFGRAVNLGIAVCDARTVIVLNNDVVCEPTFVERLSEVLDPARGIIMAAGVLVDWRHPDRIESAGVMFDQTLFAYEFLHGEPACALNEWPAGPLGPTGAAAAFDRAAFVAAGGYDEHFFAYLEDVDLAARLMCRGGRCQLAPTARARHRVSSTLGVRSAEKSYLMGWSRGYIIGKYRLHRRPGLFGRAVLGEAVLLVGQLLADRSVAGFGARLAGFAVGVRTPRQLLPPLPREALVPLTSVLRRRLRQRRIRTAQ